MNRDQPLRAAAALGSATGRVLLHSGVNADGCGRYSFVASEPACVLELRGDALRLWQGERVEMLAGDPLRVLERLADEFGANDPALAPHPVAIGTLSYDFGRHLVLGRGRVSREPDLWFGFYEAIARWDHETGECEILGDGAARDRLLNRVLTPTLARPRPPVLGKLAATTDRRAYDAAVDRILRYLRAGDCYQVNLSRRLAAPVIEPGDPLALYQELSRKSPAPYGAVIERQGSALLSGSPERFLFRAPGQNRLETRPIKGTRPRAANRELDARKRAELLASDKDAAEHLMIVDLERNDLGRVARFGSVAVEDYRRAVSLAGVHHLVSTVSCETSAGVSEIIRATFPGGSITGAPKRRAMEIIDELEPEARGAYTGCVGYLGRGRALDLAITIRSAVMNPHAVELAVGGGIVFESTSNGEFAETEDKARGWRSALQPFEQRLDLPEPAAIIEP